VLEALESKSVNIWDGADVQDKPISELAEIVKSSGIIEKYQAWSGRFCTKVKADVAAGFAQAAFPHDDRATRANKWGRVLDVINIDLYAECNDDLKSAVDGISGRLRYTRLDEDGPKMGELNEK